MTSYLEIHLFRKNCLGGACFEILICAVGFETFEVSSIDLQMPFLAQVKILVGPAGLGLGRKSKQNFFVQIWLKIC